MPPLPALFRLIASGDLEAARRALAEDASLVTATLKSGASREAAKSHFLEAILHYEYDGDTALHIAAAAHQPELVAWLIRKGADVRAKNRRGAEPLHYAVDGGPGAPSWNPRAQARVVTALVEGGAEVHATDKGEVTPLHRAVRNRCAAAVEALLKAGADPRRKNKNGSTALTLITQTTGRGGTGSPEAKAEQQKIARLLASATSGR